MGLFQLPVPPQHKHPHHRGCACQQCKPSKDCAPKECTPKSRCDG